MIKIEIKHLIFPLHSEYEAEIILDKMKIIITRTNIRELMKSIKDHVLIDHELNIKEMTAK